MAESVPGYSRQYPQDRSLRAANADRDAIGEILRRQHVAGRLDTDEFAERYGDSLQAKTYAELDQLIADFPADGEPALARVGPPSDRWPAGNGPPAGPWHPGPRRESGRSWRVPVVLCLALAVLLAVATRGRLIWVAFPLFFFVVRPLMWRAGRWGRSGRGGPGPWGCHAPGQRRGNTFV